MGAHYSRWNGLRFLGHAILVAGILYCSPLELKEKSCWYSRAFSGTAAFVIALWFIHYVGKKNEKAITGTVIGISQTQQSISFDNYSGIIELIKIKFTVPPSAMSAVEKLKIVEMKQAEKADEEIIAFFTKENLLGQSNSRLAILDEYLKTFKTKAAGDMNLFLTSQKTELKSEITL